MRAGLLCLAVAAAACVLLCSSGVSARSLFVRPERHVGALNRRLTAEQMDSASFDIQPQWFTQTLDHQDFTNNATFQQQYFINDTYWIPSNPIIFLIIGGEGPISAAYVTDHFQTGTLAAQWGAAQIAIEHRFYGQSVPNNDSSTANLKFLSSDQALEDLVTFHEFISASRPNAKWIVFGGSYSGSLSAWARLKYPNLFLGSFAASAPVQAELDFFQYFEVVAGSVGPTCSNVLSQAQSTVDTMMASPSGVAKLVSAFDLCETPQSNDDWANFMSAITSPVAEIVQYNDDAGRVSYDINTICGILTNASDPFTGLVDLWNSYNAHTNMTGCTDISYTNMIQSMQPTSDARSWTWQTCIEFGYFQTGEAGDQPFSPMISLDWFVKQCADIFGIPALTPNINWINNFYGGSEIVTSNTVFTNGDVDPWHILGNYQNYTPVSASQSILIHGTAHCADLYSQKPTDLPGLIAARATQDALLSEWLNQPTKTQVRPTVRKPAAKKILTE